MSKMHCVNFQMQPTELHHPVQKRRLEIPCLVAVNHYIFPGYVALVTEIQTDVTTHEDRCALP